MTRRRKDETMKVRHVVATVVAAIVLFGALVWLDRGGNSLLYRALAPRPEQTWQQTNPYGLGFIEHLQHLRFLYGNTQKYAEKNTLALTIVRLVGKFDLNKPEIPSDLREFIVNLRMRQGRDFEQCAPLDERLDIVLNPTAVFPCRDFSVEEALQ